MLTIFTVTLLMVSSITGQRNRDENPNEEGNGKKSNSTPSLTECHQVKANLTCPDEKISFTLYNRAHLSDGIKINATSANLRSFFNLTAPVKLIVHGIILDILTPSLITMGFGEYDNNINLCSFVKLIWIRLLIFVTGRLIL